MINPERFDGAAQWALLSPEQQAEIGAIALEVVCSMAALDSVDDDLTAMLTPIQRAACQAGEELGLALQEAFVQAIPREAIFGRDGVALLPSRIGPVCRECGCSNDDACMPACSWVEPDLCSACQSEEA